MLKPRYRNLSESLGDFSRMLDGMNKIQPLERTAADDLEALQMAEVHIARIEQQIEHVHRVLSGTGQPISEEDARNLAAMHLDAAERIGRVANKAQSRSDANHASGNAAAAAHYGDKAGRLNRLAKKHAALARKFGRGIEQTSALENKSLIGNLRTLAGIEQREMMPRDLGLTGTTRFVAGYAEMAKPFEEGEDWTPAKIATHKKKMRGVAHDVHGVGDDIDREYAKGEPDETPGHIRRMKQIARDAHRAASVIDREYKESISEAKWAAGAVKRPGRLHKHFGISPDKKIPMAMIKKEYNRLKGKPKKTASEVSLMRALALGIRFKGGDVPGGQRKMGLKGEGVEVAEEMTKAQQYRALNALYNKTGKKLPLGIRYFDGGSRAISSMMDTGTGVSNRMSDSAKSAKRNSPGGDAGDDRAELAANVAGYRGILKRINTDKLAARQPGNALARLKSNLDRLAIKAQKRNMGL